GVTSAAPERLAAPRALLADVALAATRALEPGDGARAGEAALRVVRARDERAQPALPLDELAAALRALLADRPRLLLLLPVQRLRVSALGVPRAAEEPPVAAPANQERAAAPRALRGVRGDDLAQHLVAPL